MSWNPIVVGVDASPEAAWAAAVGADMAELAGTSCRLVHAARDVSSALALTELPERAEEFIAGQVVHARERVQHGLWGVVPSTLIENVTIRPGRPPIVLRDVAREVGAELVVLGGKRHSALGRWFAGSTGLDVARTTEVPLLVTGASRSPMRRILVAVDLSAAARPTIAAAERLAGLLGGELRVLSVFEPIPIIPDAPNYQLSDYYAMLEEHVARDVWPLVHLPQAEKLTRYGVPAEVIEQLAAEWPADLVVVGSHGKGWVDRLLIGSVTERLLNRLPTSLLVVPVYAHARSREPALAAAGLGPAFA
jgi:nucleotide-binding universal stress UspA family protein